MKYYIILYNVWLFKKKRPPLLNIPDNLRVTVLLIIVMTGLKNQLQQSFCFRSAGNTSMCHCTELYCASKSCKKFVNGGSKVRSKFRCHREQAGTVQKWRTESERRVEALVRRRTHIPRQNSGSALVIATKWKHSGRVDRSLIS